MSLTIRQINQELKKSGHEVELVKGEGYFYFAGEKASNFQCSSVYVSRINDLTLDQWIAEYEEKLKINS